jgi:hypothetical protein
MRRLPVLAALLFILTGALGCAQQQVQQVQTMAPPQQGAAEDPDPSLGHELLLYVPNRVLDVFDIVRLRVRGGPGLAVGVRATRLASLYVGSYASIYAGLPGPRLRPTVKLPVGLESYSGVDVSLADATISGGIGPDYSFTEFGVSIQLLLIGVDVGLDPWEVVDFATGLVLIDLRGDDL